MKFLKNHGKKVSVVLLAMALMVTPMLNIVKAADDVTCELRYHYFFMEAENAYIKTVYKPESKAKIQKYNMTSNQWEDVDDASGESIVEDNYTSQYGLHAGFKNVLGKSSNDVFYRSIKKGTSDEYGYFKNGATGVTTDGNVKYGLKSDYSNGLGDLGAGNFLDTSDTKEAQLYNSDNNFNMTSYAQFYNLDVPDGYTFKKQEIKNSWSDEEFKIYLDMYANAQKAAEGNNGKATEASTKSGSDADYYFIHFAWTNDNTNNNYSYGYTEFKDSDNTAALSYEMKNLSSMSDSDKEALIKKIKAASVSVNTTWDTGVLSSIVGKTNSSSTLTPTITRSYSGIQVPSDSNLYVGTTPEQDSENYNDIKTQDTYHWYFMPAVGTVTFEGKGADVCNASVDTKDEDKENNPNTGVASYAIIGTLLVGAASAYIYARKNNKFNRV